MSGAPQDPSCTRVAMNGDPMSPRSTPAAATIGATIYLFGGGFDDYAAKSVTTYDTVFAFDTRTDTLAELRPGGQIPAPRVFSAGAADEENGDFYVFGGSDYNHDFTQLVAFGELYRYRVARNEWTIAADASEGPGPRIRPNLWFHEGGLFAFGGLDGSVTNHSDLWRFDLEDQRWRRIAGESEVIGGRYEAVSNNVSRDGRAFAIGGENIRADFTAELTPGTLEIDLATGTITALEIPAREDLSMGMRHMAAAAQLGGTLYVHGGDDPSDKRLGCGSPHGENPTGAIWMFDTDDRTWRLSGTEGPALKRTVASAAGGKMYVFAGWDFDCRDGVGRGQIWNTDVVIIDPSG